MNCGCNQIFATGIEVANNELILSFNRVPAITDKGFFCFRFSENLTLPNNYSTLPIYANVTVNGVDTTIPLYDKYGDVAIGSEIILNRTGGICTRYVYGMYTGIDSGATSYHGVLRNIPKIVNHSL
jgi:hypothetical protein